MWKTLSANVIVHDNRWFDGFSWLAYIFSLQAPASPKCFFISYLLLYCILFSYNLFQKHCIRDNSETISCVNVLHFLCEPIKNKS